MDRPESAGLRALRKAMADRGLTQADVARLLDVGPDIVCRWFVTERRRLPSIETAARIEELFGIRPAEWAHLPDEATDHGDAA